MMNTANTRFKPTAATIEHHVARGMKIAVVQISAGDEITILDIEGGQRAELTVLSPNGGFDFEALGITSFSKVTGLSAYSNFPTEQDNTVTSVFRLAAVDRNRALTASFFGKGSEQNTTVSFMAERTVICVITAPGIPMSIDGQTPPGAIVIKVRRASIQAGMESIAPPPPLADPRLDFQVDRATALAYQVKAGEFIQIIDLAGRQCSDFLAFHLADLERGVERGIDATTTRTLTGLAVPRPGLAARFFDQEMRPLVEIVRDTVGKHDAFQLACNSKYYEDMGYPGHINCSDNFTEAAKPHGISGRKGWPAINFFNNADYGPTTEMKIDEPWSRPGDYVLMRALSDLVCLSSACPDDIGPSNGWNLTDVHLRVYSPTKLFSKGIAHRMTPNSAPQLTQDTAFHPRTSALTKSFADYRGYWLPTVFDQYGIAEEYYACREHAAVMDLSALRKFEILGPDAETLLQRTLTRDISRMASGHVIYSAMCNETGGVLDDGTLFRLGPTNFRWACNDEYDGVWMRDKAEEYGLSVKIKDSTDEIQNISIQGPDSRKILEQILWTSPTQITLSQLGRFRFVVGRIGTYDGMPVLVSRTGYTGGLGFEVWCHPKDALSLWDSVWTAGTPFGLIPAGSAAMDILRIEAGLVFAGQEFDDQVDPFETGIGFTVALKSKADITFVGKEALIRRKAAQNKVLVGLELSGNESASHGDGVYHIRNKIGFVTSGTLSPILRKNIALCRIAIEYSTVGTNIEVGKPDGHQKRILAKVVSLPFFVPPPPVVT